MSIAQQEYSISTEELIHAAGKLGSPELEFVTDHILTLRAKRRSPHLSKDESELLLKINNGLPDETWKRFHTLNALLHAESITDEERSELLKLIDQVEETHALRMGYLVELSILRGTTLENLMQSLGIGPRPDA